MSLIQGPKKTDVIWSFPDICQQINTKAYCVCEGKATELIMNNEAVSIEVISSNESQSLMVSRAWRKKNVCKLHCSSQVQRTYYMTFSTSANVEAEICK